MLRVPIGIHHGPITRCGRLVHDDRRLRPLAASLNRIEGVTAELVPIGNCIPRLAKEEHPPTKNTVQVWYKPKPEQDTHELLYAIDSQREFLADGGGVRHDEFVAAVKWKIEALQDELEGTQPV